LTARVTVVPLREGRNMLLSITTTYPPASDLGDLLHKRPAASTNGHERPQAPTTRCPSVFEC